MADLNAVLDATQLSDIASGLTAGDMDTLYGFDETSTGIEAELKGTVEKNLEYAPPEIVGRVHQAANELFSEIHQLSTGEKEYGPSGAWEEFRANKTEIKEDLHALGETLRQTKEIAGKLISHTVEQGCQKVVGAFNKGRDFMQKQNEQIRLRTPQESLAAELAEMERLAQRLEKYIKITPQEMRPELLKVQEAGMVFSQKMKDLQGLENNPLAIRTPVQKEFFNEIIKEIGRKAKDVRQSIEDFPIAVNNAVKDKSDELLSKACGKVLAVFDKAMEFLDKQRKRIMEIAPDTKLERQASPKKIYLTYAQNAVLYDPSLSGKKLDQQVALSLYRGGYGDRKVKECMAQSPTLKNLGLKERTAQINSLVKEASRSRETSYSR